MEYIIKQTIEVITRIEADSKEEAFKLSGNLDIDDADQVTILETEIEAIDEYEESFK